jgi:hypothetical protein
LNLQSPQVHDAPDGGEAKPGKSLSEKSKTACGQCVGENSTGTVSRIRNNANIFESSRKNKTQYFVDVVNDERWTQNNNFEFLIVCRGFPDPLHDKWEPLAHLSGSEHMIREFNQQWEVDYVRKTAETLRSVSTLTYQLWIVGKDFFLSTNC